MSKLACLSMIASSIGCVQVHAMECDQDEFVGSRILHEILKDLKDSDKLIMAKLLKAALWIIKYDISGGEKDLNADRNLIIRDLKKSLVTNNANLQGEDIKPEHLDYEPEYRVSLEKYMTLEPRILQYFERGGWAFCVGLKLDYDYKPFWDALEKINNKIEELSKPNCNIF